jgi:hypothetical protein
VTHPATIPPRAGGTQLRRTREPLWQMIVLYGALTLMALGDAYGFYSVLIGIYQQDSFLVLLLVIALTLGSVAAAHEIGRLTRSRQEGRDGNVWWIAALATIWLTVGGAIAWLRAVRPIGVDSEAGTTELQVALLLLGLYLLTGSLAMTAAHRFGNPRTAEQRDLLRQRATAAQDLSTAHRELELAKTQLENLHLERQRNNDQHEANSELPAAMAEYVNQEARLQVARRIRGGPGQTDGVLRPPSNPGEGPSGDPNPPRSHP